MLYVQFSGT